VVFINNAPGALSGFNHSYQYIDGILSSQEKPILAILSEHMMGHSIY